MEYRTSGRMERKGEGTACTTFKSSTPPLHEHAAIFMYFALAKSK
jgi:hypothetical protein